MNRDDFLKMLLTAAISGNAEVKVMKLDLPKQESSESEDCDCAACVMKGAMKSVLKARMVYRDAKLNKMGLDDLELIDAKTVDAKAELGKAQEALYVAMDAFIAEREEKEMQP